jgi:DNA repair exonuclease SbcCD ATPase subunit
MSELICDICEKTYSSVYTLERHKRTSKSCCSIDVKKFTCEWCNFESTLKYNLLSHQEGCKYQGKHTEKITAVANKYKKVIDTVRAKNKELKEQVASLTKQVASLQGKIEVLEKRPPSTVIKNKNIYINKNNKIQFVMCDKIKPLTDKTIDEAIADGSYTFDHFIRGIPGLIDFIAPIIKQEEERNYACTDGARNKFKRLDEDRDWVDDKKAEYIHTILTKLKPEIERHNKQLSNDIDEEQAKQLRFIYRAVSMPSSAARQSIFTAVRAGVKSVALI